MGFYIGSKAPRTRRSQQAQIFKIAHSYELSNEDISEIATEILGRRVESVAEINGFSDEEMFVLWCAVRGTSAVNAARYYNGNLDKLISQLEKAEESEEVTDEDSWLNF